MACDTEHAVETAAAGSQGGRQEDKEATKVEDPFKIKTRHGITERNNLSMFSKFTCNLLQYS